MPWSRLFSPTLLSTLLASLPVISASAGTAALTRDLYSGYQYESPSVEPGSFAQLNNTLYFVGSHYNAGRELWNVGSLGAGSPDMVKDIRPGLASSEIAEITTVGSRVFFSANDGTGRELWISDGTSTGTKMVAQMAVAPNVGSSPRALTALNGRVLFWARGDNRKVSLWASDGTEQGTLLLKEAGAEDIDATDFAPGSLVLESGQLYFAITTLTSGRELWKTNGTRAGTVQVKDIHPGPLGSEVAIVAASGQGHVYLQANDGIHGTELWKSDGTADGTVLIKDLAPSGNSFQIEKVAVQGGNLFFSGYSEIHDRAIWRTDGTAAGTVLLHDFVPIGPGPEISTLASITGRLLVTFSSPAWQDQLWSVDPATGDATIVLDLRQSPTSHALSDLTVSASGTVAFFKDTQTAQQQIWKYDGQVAPVVAHSAIIGASVRLGGTFNDSLFYTTGYSLRVLNPNRTLMDVGQLKWASSSPQFLRVFGESVFFGAYNESIGRELHALVSQGSYLDAYLFQDIDSGLGSDPEPLIDLNGSMYFLATTSATGRELWKTDGTNNGTMLVKDIRPGAASSEISSIVSLDGKLYFSARGADGDVELWRSDGTSGGTVQYANLNPTGSSHPTQLTVANGVLYFVADNGTDSAALWRTLGTSADIVRVGTVGHIRELTLRNPVPGAPLLPASPVLYFVGRAALGGEEGLYRTDGTTAGTLKIPHTGSIVPASIHGLTVMDERLVFLAGPAGDVRVWTTEGLKAVKSALTVRVDDDSVLLRAGAAVYFQGVNTTKTGIPIGQPGIWRTNKTASAAIQIQPDDETVPGKARLLSSYEGILFFSTPLPFINESTLWSTHGNPETTRPVEDVTLAGTGENFSLVRFGDHLLFPGVKENNGEELLALSLSPELEVVEVLADGRQIAFEGYYPTMEWGLVSAGSTTNRTIRIRNAGYAAQSGLSVVMSGTATGPGFTVSPSSIPSIPAGGWVDAKVTFAPLSLNYYYVDVSIRDTAGGYEYFSIDQDVSVWSPYYDGYGIQTRPLSALVLENSAFKFKPVIYTVPPTTWSWKQDLKEVGKAQELSFSSVKASHAGTYSLTVDSQIFYPSTFDSVSLAVVSRAPSSVVSKPGQTLTLSCRVASPPAAALSYQWFRNGLPLYNINRVNGSRSATLTVEDSQESDSAQYSCLVTLTVNEVVGQYFPEVRVLTLNHGTTAVTVTDKPAVQLTTLPDLFVGEEVDLQLPATFSPLKYIAKGLPAGILMNATTGRITGRPVAAKGIDKKTGQLLPYSVTFTVTNAAGTSTPVTLTWLVKPLMNAGVYQGLIARSLTGAQPGLGGRVQLTATATGTLSGQVTQEGKIYRFTKILDTVSGPSLTTWIDVPRGKGVLSAQLELQPGTNGITATLHEGVSSLGGALYPPAYSKTVQASDYDGPYTNALEPQISGDNIPDGSGFISATVALTGDVKWTGRLADGTAITGAGFLAQRSGFGLGLPVHMPLYKNTGSVHGWLNISSPAPLPLTTGTLSWIKYPILGVSKDRTYKSGIPLHDLGITGSLYVPPAKTDILFGVPATDNNFSLTLSGAGLSGSITRSFTLAALGKLTLPPVADRPPVKSLSLVVAKGTFAGQISFTDPNPAIPAKPHVRTVACQGVLLTAQKYASGFFLLPQLPVSTPVQTTLTTSPILSGDVLIEETEQDPE